MDLNIDVKKASIVSRIEGLKEAKARVQGAIEANMERAAIAREYGDEDERSFWHDQVDALIAKRDDIDDDIMGWEGALRALDEPNTPQAFYTSLTVQVRGPFTANPDGVAQAMKDLIEEVLRERLPAAYALESVEVDWSETNDA